MSKRVNVNPGQYKVEGRLKPDEMASARQRQQRESPGETARNLVRDTPERATALQRRTREAAKRAGRSTKKPR